MPEATKIPSRASPEVVRILEVNYEPPQGSQIGWCDGHWFCDRNGEAGL